MGPQEGPKMDPQLAQIATQIGPEAGLGLGTESRSQSGRLRVPKWTGLGSVFGSLRSPSRPAGSGRRFRRNPAPEGVRRAGRQVQNLSVLNLRSQIVVILSKIVKIVQPLSPHRDRLRRKLGDDRGVITSPGSPRSPQESPPSDYFKNSS